MLEKARRCLQRLPIESQMLVGTLIYLAGMAALMLAMLE